MRYSLIILLSILTTVSVTAQKSKFGDVKPEDFSSYPAEFDSTESAVILFDVAKSQFNNQLDVEFERHVRIKILTDEGVEWGEVAIPFNKNIDQDIYGVEGITYEIIGNEISKTELKKEDIFEENVTGEIYTKKFALPAMSKGTIVEYKYKKMVGSAFYLPDWEFHKSVPVQYSEYEMKVPHNYKYTMIMSGVDSTFISKNEEYIDPRGGGVTTTVSKKDIPAVKNIPFITTPDDFKTKLLNQLIYINHSGSPRRTFGNTWEKIAKEIRSNEAIGKQRLNGKMKDQVELLINDSDNDVEKTKKLYKYVSENIEWNGLHRVLSYQGIRDAFDTREGNSADLNLMLVRMLQHAEVEVYPVFLSTRENGFLSTNYPIIHQFNNVVAVVNLESGSFLLDATEGYRHLGQPPLKDLYRVGFMVTDEDFFWVETAPDVNTSKILFVEHDLSSADTVRTLISGTIDGYFAERLRNMTSDERRTYLFDNSRLNAKMDSLKIEGLENPLEALKVNISLSFAADEVIGLEDLIYLNPSFISESETPFKDRKREFPVYFPFTFKERIVTKLILPENYTLEEFTEPKTITIGNNLARFRYITQKAGNSLTILEDFSVNTTIFSSNDYSSVKRIFDEYYEYKNKPIVLKRSVDEAGNIDE